MCIGIMTNNDFQTAEEVTETNLTVAADVSNKPNALVAEAGCPVCKQSVPMDDTVVYSRRNRAFLHLTCRDMVLARQKQRDAVLLTLVA